MAVSDHCLHLVSSLPLHFSLEKAVCSYGFFMMAPNSWVVSSSSSPGNFLERPLRLLDGRAVQSRISESNNQLNICLLGLHELDAQDKHFIIVQVSRMLRLSETEMSAVAAFHALHLHAREEGFGRLFRSPTLFEDIIKSILLCNCGTSSWFIQWQGAVNEAASVTTMRRSNHAKREQRNHVNLDIFKVTGHTLESAPENVDEDKEAIFAMLYSELMEAEIRNTRSQRGRGGFLVGRGKGLATCHCKVKTFSRSGSSSSTPNPLESTLRKYCFDDKGSLLSHSDQESIPSTHEDPDSSGNFLMSFLALVEMKMLVSVLVALKTES